MYKMIIQFNLFHKGCQVDMKKRIECLNNQKQVLVESSFKTPESTTKDNMFATTVKQIDQNCDLVSILDNQILGT